MEQLLEREGIEEAIISRISVNEDIGNLRITIKSNPFFLGNNILTLLLGIVLFTQAAFAGLIFNSTINLTTAVAAVLCLGCIALIVFLKFWLWHHFGEELISFQGHTLEVNRSYGLFNGKPKTITFNKMSELFVNRADTWSWLEMRSKGMLRIVSDQEITDCGIKLEDAEYAMLLKAVADRLNMLKETSVSNKTMTIPKTNGKKVMPKTNGKIVMKKNGVKRNGKTNGHLNGHNNNPSILNGNSNSIENQDSKNSGL